MNSDELQVFTEQDEPRLAQLVLSTARDQRRLPTGAEFLAVCRPIPSASA